MADKEREREAKWETENSIYPMPGHSARGCRLVGRWGEGEEADKSEQESSAARSRIGDLFGNYCTGG